MKMYPVVTLTFRRIYPGRFPGELGLLSKTILKFTDRRGRISALAFRLRDLQAKLHGTLHPILIDGYFRRRQAVFIRYCRKRTQERLNNRARRLVIRALKNGFRELELQVAHETTSDGFTPVEHQFQAMEIADDLGAATDFWFWVRKAA